MQAWALLGVPWPPGAPKHPSFRACTVIKKGPGLTPMATSGPHPKDCVVLDTVVGLLGLTRPLINSGTRETITLGPGAQSTPIGQLLTTQLSVLCAPHPVSSPPVLSSTDPSGPGRDGSAEPMGPTPPTQDPGRKIFLSEKSQNGHGFG